MAEADETKRIINIIYTNDIEAMRQYLKEGGDVDFSINGGGDSTLFSKVCRNGRLLT